MSYSDRVKCESCDGSGSQGERGCEDCLGKGLDPFALGNGIESALNDAYAEGRKDEREENGAASRLIGAWVAAHGKPIPWKSAVEIVAIVNKLSDAERAALLALDD